jgi:hypothetical protein
MAFLVEHPIWTAPKPANTDAEPSSPWDFCWFSFWADTTDARQARAEERERILQEQ